MKITIVTEPSPGWVLRRISDSLADNLPNTTVSTEPDLTSDINFYVNYALFKEKTTLDVGWFTHREKDGPLVDVFNNAAKRVDLCIAQCKKTAALLPLEKTYIMQAAPDEQFHKKNIIFGVVGREYPSGRKRFHWIDELRKINGIEIKFTNSQIPWDKMPDFYREIDYLLILSDNEGGPIPLLEALAMGVPVISSDVGFAKEYTTIIYDDLEDLKKIINKLIIPKNIWKILANNLEVIFKDLINKNRKNA